MTIVDLVKTEQDANEILQELTTYANKPHYILMGEFHSMYHNELLWQSRTGEPKKPEALAQEITYSTLNNMMELYMK